MKLTAQINLFNHIGFLDKLLFTKHLAVMLRSGIPLSEAVSTLADETKNQSFKKVLKGVWGQIQNGQSLYKALSSYLQVFDPLYLSLVKIGEKSGKLEENLNYLIIQQTKSYEFRKKVTGALLYPALVLISTAVAGSSLSLFVLPKLVDLFRSLDVKLPLSTKILLFVSNLMKDYGILIIISLTAILALVYWLVHTAKVKPHWHRFLLSIPALGVLLQNVELSSICRNVGLMLKSGLPIMAVLEAQCQVEGNLVYKDYLEQIRAGVDKGKSIAETLRPEKFPFIPQFMAKMIGVGEKTGKLEESFLYLGDFFEGEVDDTTKNLSNILEPVLLLILGLVVGFVALSIISPIYQLTGSIRAR